MTIGRSIAIVGGTGFIGKHLCEELARRGISATIISRHPDIHFLAGLSVPFASCEAGSAEARACLSEADSIVYLAHGAKPSNGSNLERQGIENDLLPLIDLLSLVRAAGRRPHLIYLSSGGQIYGRQAMQPIDEETLPKPTTAYGLGKQLAEQAINYFSSTQAVFGLVLRAANPVGRWQLGGKHGFMSLAVESALKGKSLAIFGSGENMRDYFSVDEFAALVAGICNSGSRIEGTFNIGSGVGLTERQVVKLVEEEAGRPLQLNWQPARPFDLPANVLQISRARESLAWNPGEDARSLISRLALQMRDR